MTKSIYILLISIFLFASCEKKDSPIILPPKGNGNVMHVDMGENYDYQFFISLENNKIVHISSTHNWDLAFSSKPNEHGIYLNGAKLMSAINTHKTNFADVGFTDSLDKGGKWKYDEASGLIDSTAIGDWTQKNEVYLIKLSNTSNQIRKIKFLSEDIYEYKVEVGDINSTEGAVLTILKNKQQNYTYFSFDFLSTVNGVEPNNTDWDIQITTYNYTFFDQNPILPYIVNGALLNPNGTIAYKDSLNVYNNLDENFATSHALSSKKNTIGYDWKKYDIDKNLYSIDNRYSYIIKTQSGQYFKLHFLDFYSSTGIKGSPKFEFEQIK